MPRRCCVLRAQVKEGAVLHGFAANVTQDAVFVRFAGHVTGEGPCVLQPRGLVVPASPFATPP